MLAKKAVFIFGPTGVGKSRLAETIAEKKGFEIINMDAGSFIQPLSIGTAKPDVEKIKVRCHLFDVIDEPRDFNVVEYRARVVETIADMTERRATPLFVGGSAFYFKSLFFPPVNDLGHTNIEKIKRIFSKKELWELLKKVDPIRARTVHFNDTYRIERALTIWGETDQKPSNFVPQFDPLFKKSIIMYVGRERQELYNRINARVDHMVKQGFLSEVLALTQYYYWKEFVKWKKLIGYTEFFEYLKTRRSDEDFADTVDKIKRRTRNYAKRQNTFWRMLKKELNAVTTKEKKVVIKEVNLSLIPTSEQAEKIMGLI